MSEYKLIKNSSGVQRNSDGAFIPDNESNGDWVEYQKWLLEGGVPEPAQTLEEAKINKKLEIKSETGRLITSFFPEHSQRNLLARTSELILKKMNNTISSAEESELSQNEAIWNWVKLVRTESSVAVSQVDARQSISEVEGMSYSLTPYSI